MVSFVLSSATALEDGPRDIVWRLSNQPVDWRHNLAAIKNVTTTVELVHCFSADCDLFDVVFDAATDSLV